MSQSSIFFDDTVIQTPQLAISGKTKKMVVIVLSILAISLFFYHQQTRFDSRFEIGLDYKIPILYIWLGDPMPDHYKYRLDWITFPWKLIGQKEWQELGTDFHKYNLSHVEKSDILRLLYLQKYPGVYADIDCIIDYPCLMKMVSKKAGFFMAGEPYLLGYPRASNFLLFVDQANHPLIAKSLQETKNRLGNLSESDKTEPWRIMTITGPYILKGIGVPKIDQLYQCVYHQGDGFWNPIT